VGFSPPSPAAVPDFSPVIPAKAGIQTAADALIIACDATEPRSLRRRAAVYHQRLARHKRRLAASQKQRAVGYLARLAVPL